VMRKSLGLQVEMCPLCTYLSAVVVSAAELNAKAASLPVLHAVDAGLQVRSSLYVIYYSSICGAGSQSIQCLCRAV
jgi:hypothetical protein